MNRFFKTTAVAAHLAESDYTGTLAREYNQLEAENEMKWGWIRPTQTSYNFTGGDALVAFAEANDMAVCGHNLLWHLDHPAWLTQGTFTPAQLKQIMQDHIANVVQHWAGKVYAWDVVNEAFSGNTPSVPRESIWNNQPGIGMPGTAYIEQAFRWAHAADPGALMFYNEYGIEDLGAKFDAVYAMALDFTSRGVPFDGIGIQMHIDTMGYPSLNGLDTVIRRFNDLGLRVHITEMDVRLSTANGGPQGSDLTQQAAIYNNIATVCLKHPLCDSIQTWGFTDKYSWVPCFFTGFGAALPFDQNYQPKPAYATLLSSVTNAPPRATSAGLVHAASYDHGAVSPGELVTLFGGSLGPQTLASLQLTKAGLVANSLSGTSITFDSLPAPLIFVQANQLSAIVPYAVATQSTTSMIVTSANGASQTLTLSVAPTHPGLFTLNQRGTGQAAALNQDGHTGNGSAHPAPRGSIVSLYGTGAGQTTPAGIDGSLAGNAPPQPLASVSVTISGQSVKPDFAGGAPGEVAGVIQINVRIPQTVTAGDVPVTFTVGHATSQAGVTLAVE